MQLNKYVKRLDLYLFGLITIMLWIFSIYVFTLEVIESEGVIVDFSCKQDKKHKSIYSYDIKLQDGKTYFSSNSFACNSISSLQKGNIVKVIARGNEFLQLSLNNHNLFPLEKLKEDDSFDNSIYLIMVVLFTFLFYRRYRQAASINKRGR